MNGKIITIRQIPVPQPRPRITMRGTYNPAQKKKKSAIIQVMQQIQGLSDFPLVCPINMQVHFYLPIPKGTSKKNHEQMCHNKIKHQKLGDLDNYLKYLFDVMNNLVFKDDKQIWKVDAQKEYSHDPRTVVLIEW